MKKTAKPERTVSSAGDLAAEGSFDYWQAKPNRFAERAQPGSVAVVLDLDVARVFTDAGAVNNVLRALMATMPRQASR